MLIDILDPMKTPLLATGLYVYPLPMPKLVFSIGSVASQPFASCPIQLWDSHPQGPVADFNLQATYTLFAHLVTRRPSFKQSISPFPALSLLHCMKSSLYDLHLAPMKKLADSNGAELLPISSTGGMSAGRGVVSMRVV